ncbi:MAG: phosphotransacetylase [Candidatus Omnitrophica bacterium]|nr:phosphotransacetylase [Candidatus Omnitrophota bacterium]
MLAVEKIKTSAKEKRKRIVLPESSDERVVKAARTIIDEGIADIFLIKEKPHVKEDKELAGHFVYPSTYPKMNDLVEIFVKSQKKKDASRQEARDLLLNEPLYFAVTMVKAGLADSVVAGATYPTRDVIRANIRCLGIDRSVGVVFGLFIIEAKDSSCGQDNIFVFADCAVIPSPNKRQLVKICIKSADLLQGLFNIEPRVALLTYSSHGSAEGESIELAREALSTIRGIRPGLCVDGELQLDAAIVPHIYRHKAPQSPLKGRANVLIFPNLDAANITYKAVERFARAKAVGPILIGLNKITSDLSRGCDTEDIVNTVALTSVLTGFGDGLGTWGTSR